MKAGNYDLTIAEIEGFNLLVPKTFLKETEEERDSHTGGCGPGGLGDLLVPDRILGESIFLPCKVHDDMYHHGITEEDKQIADLVFDWNGKVVIQGLLDGGGKDISPIDIARVKIMTIYYLAVSYGGKDAFFKNKGPEVEDIKISGILDVLNHMKMEEV